MDGPKDGGQSVPPAVPQKDGLYWDVLGGYWEWAGLEAELPALGVLVALDGVGGDRALPTP